MDQLARHYFLWFICLFPLFRLCGIFSLFIGATTVEKLGGDHTRDGFRFPLFLLFSFLLSSFFAQSLLHSLISLAFYIHSTHPVKSPCGLAKSLSAYKVMRRVQRKKWQSQKLEGTKYTWSPSSPKLEGTHPTGPVGLLRLSVNSRVHFSVIFQFHCSFLSVWVCGDQGGILTSKPGILIAYKSLLGWVRLLVNDRSHVSVTRNQLCMHLRSRLTKGVRKNVNKIKK